MMTVEDRKILMRDRCIKCGDLRSFFLPPSMVPLAQSFGSVSFDHSLGLFSSYGFHVIMLCEFHFIFSFNVLILFSLILV